MGIFTIIGVVVVILFIVGYILKIDTLCLEDIYRQRLMRFSQHIFGPKNIPQVGQISSHLVSSNPP